MSHAFPFGEHEQAFACPYCDAPITMLLDPSVEGTQRYVEDCEVCCNPIGVTVDVVEGDVAAFRADSIEQ